MDTTGMASLLVNEVVSAAVESVDTDSEVTNTL